MTSITEDLIRKKCERTNQPVMLEAINLFEKEAGVRMPQDMKDFYMLTNGCDFDRYKNNICVNGKILEQIQWIDRLEELLRRNEDIKENLQNYDTFLHEFDKYWSIGFGAYGNNIFIGHSEDNFGTIYLSQKNEEYEINDNKWVIPMIKIANSLSNFIENLR